MKGWICMIEFAWASDEIRQAIETGLVRQLLQQQVLTEREAAKILKILKK